MALRTAGRPENAGRPRLSIWLAFKRLTALSFPRRFPIVQFPNLPLMPAEEE